MTRTSVRVAFGLFALTVKQDATFAASSEQSFSKVADLKTGNVSSKPIATFEPDYWLLDGGYKIRATDDDLVHVGLMSLAMSDAAGVFAVPPALTITFGSVQNTDGLTIRFSQYSNDHADDLDVAYYDASNVLIRTDNYTPADWEFSTGQAVNNFKKIIITFHSTNKPYRYLRVTGLDFGELIYFTGADITNATMIQEVHPLSIELPLDTMDINLFSSTGEFSIINPSGAYADLQEKQPIDVYEIVDNVDVYLGQYFIDTWENPSNNEIHFKTFDRLGLLDGRDYMGGIWITPIDSEDLIDAVMTAAGAPYELDPLLYGIEIQGWVPICSYREALQQIAFTIGAYVTCARSGVVRIVKTVLASELTTYDTEIPKSQKSLDQSLTLRPLVTGVEIIAHNYIENSELSELYNDVLPAGYHTIKFDTPMHDLSASGAIIIESGANYAILFLLETSTVTLEGQGYTDTVQIKGIYNNFLPNVPPNILSIDSATLVNPSNVDTVAQRVYDYYQQRYLQKVKLYAPSAEPGGSVLIDTLYDQQIAGIVEKMTMNLTGGFTVQTEIVGVVA